MRGSIFGKNQLILLSIFLISLSKFSIGLLFLVFLPPKTSLLCFPNTKAPMRVWGSVSKYPLNTAYPRLRSRFLVTACLDAVLGAIKETKDGVWCFLNMYLKLKLSEKAVLLCLKSISTSFEVNLFLFFSMGETILRVLLGLSFGDVPGPFCQF